MLHNKFSVFCFFWLHHFLFLFSSFLSSLLRRLPSLLLYYRLSFNLSFLTALTLSVLYLCLCQTYFMFNKAFKPLCSYNSYTKCDVVPQCRSVGTYVTPNCHGNPCHTLSVTHHTHPIGTWGEETVERLQWEAHSVVCAHMHTYSYLNSFYQNLIILHTHVEVKTQNMCTCIHTGTQTGLQSVTHVLHCLFLI